MNGSRGYTQAALQKLETGTYRGRKQKYRTSEDQINAVNKIPALEGMTRSPNFNTQKTGVDTVSARRKYEQRIGHNASDFRDLRNRGYNSSYKGVDFSKTSDLERDMLDAEVKQRNARRKSDEYLRSVAPDSYAAKFENWRRSLNAPSQEDDIANRQHFIDTYGASKDEVLNAYEQYLEAKERAKREEHPYLTALEDIKSAPVRSLASAAGELSHALFPNSDLDLMANSDEVQKEVKEVQKKRNYVQNSSKLSDTQKKVAKAVYSGSDFLTNAAVAALTGGSSAVADVASGTGAVYEAAPWVRPAVNAVLGYGQTAGETRNELERQGVDTEKARQMANASGLISAAANAYMMSSKVANTAGQSFIKSVLKAGAKSGAAGAGSQAANELAQKLVLDNQSQFDADVQRYVSQGMSEKEAGQKAAVDVLARVGTSGGLGFIVGAGLSAVSNGLPKLKAKSKAYDPYEDLRSVWYQDNALPQNERPLLTGTASDTQAIPGTAYNQVPALPDNIYPIQMPGTNGVISLDGPTLPIVLGDNQAISAPVRTAAATAATKNPTLTRTVESVRAEINDLTNAIENKYAEYTGTPKYKKRKVWKEYEALKEQKAAKEYELRNVTRANNGLVDLSKRDFNGIDEFKNDLKLAGKTIGGKKGRELAQTAITALDSFESTGTQVDLKNFIQATIALKNESTDPWVQTLFARIMPTTEDKMPSGIYQAMGNILKRSESAPVSAGNAAPETTTLAPRVDENNRNVVNTVPTSSMDVPHQLAERFAQIYSDFDPYDYGDGIYEMDSYIESMAKDISDGADLRGYIDVISEAMEDTDNPELLADMQSLVDDLTKIQEQKVNAEVSKPISSPNIINNEKNILRVPDDIQVIAQNNKSQVIKLPSVATIQTGMFKDGEGRLPEKVGKYWAKWNNRAYNDVLGEVTLTSRNVKDSIFHNALTRRKVDTFAAVPDVIEKGMIVDYQPSWKGRDYDTALIVAPVTITDSNGNPEEYITGVIVRRNSNMQKFYTHDAVSVKKNESSLETREIPKDTPSEGENSSSVYNILRKIANDKAKINAPQTELEANTVNSVPALTNNVSQNVSNDNQINNGYWLRLLGDNDFLEMEARNNNIDPAALRSIAAANTGLDAAPPSNNVPHIDGVMPDDDRMKTSQAYTNTGKYGGGWTEEEYDQYTDPMQFQYESIDEEESVKRAIDMRSKEGREAFKERMMNAKKASGAEIDGLMMEWRELGEEARALEAAGNDASAVWKESVKVFRKIQELSTESAQGLQALAKWSRNTPEGMLAQAENIINGKDNTDKTKLRETLDKIEKNNKKVKFSENFVVDFLKEADKLEGLHPDSQEANEIMARLGKMVNAQIPAKFGEKLTSFLMDNMLGNFRTLITRNAGGNVGLNIAEQLVQRPLAAGIDSLLSIKTGQRTQAGLTKEGLTEYIQGFAKGVKDEARDYKTGLHTARSGENTLARAISANRHVFKSKVMDRLDNLVKQGLSIGDRPFYEAVYKQTIGDYYRLRDRGVMGDTLQNMSDSDFETYAKTAAQLNALGAVYQQDTMLSKALLEFKGAVGDLSRGILGADILSQFSMPFVKTPANVIERAVDYSPLGIVRNAFRTGKEVKSGSFDQNRFANESARNILGTALMAGGAGLAAKGIISGAYSDDKDEKQAQKESGMQEYALNMGDKQMDISWIPVVGSNNVAAAAAYYAAKNGGDNFLKNLATGAKKGGQALFDQSMFQGLQRLFGTGETYNSDEGIVGNMGNVVKSGLGQGIPSLARQTGQVIDPYQRDVAYSNEGKELGFLDNYDLNSLANNVPGLREKVLAPKVGTSGELLKENQGRNVGMKILEDMILPGKLTKVEYSDLNKEAIRLDEETTSKDGYMPKAIRKNVDTDEHTLTNKEWVDYQQRYYKEMTNAGTKLLDSDFYKKASAGEQVKMLKGVYDGIKDGINTEYNGKKVSGAAKNYVEAGGGDKGVKAVVDYYNEKKIKEEVSAKTGVGANTKAAKEIAANIMAGNTKAAETQMKEVKEKTEQKQQNAENKQVASDLDIETKTYNKIADKAGKNADKVYNAIPSLKRSGLGTSSAYYQYADALNVDPNLSSGEFAKTFNAIDSDNSKGIKQDELINYFNKNKTSQQQADKMWKMYGDSGWKKLPVLVNGSFVKK